MSLNPDGFDDRLAKARAAVVENPSDGSEPDTDAGFAGAMGFGMRAGGQFVAAVVVGGLVGWALDRWLGTRPFGMLIVMILCFIGAIVNVWLMMSRAVASATDASVRDVGASGVRPRAAMEKVTDKVDGESS